MSTSTLLLSVALLAVDDPAKSAQLQRRLQDINVAEAKHWRFFLDEDYETKAELVDRPVYFWTNPTKGGGQHGAVFVWTWEGRPQVVGSIFAHPLPMPGARRLVHEFHSLAPDVVFPECDDGEPELWNPKAGLKRQPLADAPPPAASAAKRLLQMRALGRRFGGHTVDWRKERWELRLLPQPLFRYERPKGELVDGALLALVTDAGTDPEILLILEATRDGWHYALARFTDSSFHVELDKKEVLSAVRGTPEWAQHFNPDHTYRTLHKRILTASDVGDDLDEQP